jgi:hypothetical protein
MADANFWRDMAGQFLALPDRHGSSTLRADWICITRDDDAPPQCHWQLSGGRSPQARLEFTTLAQRCGVEIDGTSDSFIVWLEALKRELPNLSQASANHEFNTDGTIAATYTGLCIPFVYEASANVCKILESRALDQERKARLGEQQKTEPLSLPSDSSNCTRSREIDTFIQKCNQHSTTRIFKSHIWKSVGHRTARQFEYWQACDEKKATPEDQRNFSRILRTTPEEFVATLKRQNLIPPA